MKIFLKVITLLLLPSLIAGQQENPYLSSLYRSLSDATSDTARMEAYSNLGSYYLLEDRDSTDFYLEKALPIAVKLNLKLDEASILNKMGVTLMQQEKFSKSLEFYLKAVNIAKDPSIEKTIWHLSPGQTPMNARMLELSNSYDLIGLLNAYTGNWIDNTKNQLKNYREAEKYAKAAGDKGPIAYINFHMGIAYMNEGKLDSALMLMKKAISTFSDLKDQSGLGRAMKFLGDTYEKMGNLDLAANTILQAIPFLKETNDYLHVGLGYISLSHVYADLKNNDSALYYARESLKIFEKRKDAAWKRDAYNLLASCFDRLGRTDSATVYLKLAKSLSDSLSVEERKNLLAFLDVVVDEQVKLEKLEKEKIETREKLRIYLLTTGIVVFIVIVFLLYRNNQHRKKTNETLRQRNEKIENTLHQLRSAQAQLVQSEKMASLGELTAGIAHEIQNPLNFVNNFSEVNMELLSEMKDEMKKGNLDEVNAIANDIIENELKINHHGKRADAIVKGMLQHSRSTGNVKEQTDINVLADEYLRLAYHGLRAKDKLFNATMKTDYDETIGKINIVPQDIGRVILNVITNAFYTVNEKRKQVSIGLSTVERLATLYEPTVSISTKKLGDAVEFSVKDNGNGIPQKAIDKIFQPFFTTKPTGQGTGLGLSLAYDIIKAHGGEIKVETKEGEGTEFIIQLPVHNK
ncbi:MAG: ATP-binding protein, partial [Bacteroidota bacterium]